MRLGEAGLTLEAIDLGAVDAESDYKLAQYFVATRHAQSAIKGRRTLLLGRKGSGKSALFRQLPQLLVEAGNSAEVVQLTPDAYAWGALKEYTEQGLPPEHAHANAWKLTLAIETAGRLVARDHEWSAEADNAVRTLRQFIAENFGDLEPSLVETATKIGKGLRSFNLSAFGFGVGFEKDAETQDRQPVTPAVIDALLDTLAVPLSELGVILELDRLDDAWDGSLEAHQLMIGLLKAAKDMNDGFGAGEGGLRVVTFLRTDIYDGLLFDDKDKHRQTEEHIVWDQEGLREMISRRLPGDVETHHLFEAGEMRGSIQPFNYIVKRTFLRPREVIQFVQLAVQQAGPEAIEVSKEAIRAAEDLYSKWKVEDLKQEFARVHPTSFEPLLEALRQEVHRYDTIEELDKLLGEKAPAVIEEVGARGALELLFDASVIGIRLKGAGSTRFKAEDPQLTLPSAGAVYVHQSLYKGLNISEARKAADSPAEEDVAVAEPDSDQ